jgi:hypothetical protein
MKNGSHAAIRVLLWLTAAYHLVAGVAATIAQEQAVALGAFLFGMSITLTPEASLLVRYLGVFGITLGVLAACAALDPVGNRKIVLGLIVYFLVRAGDRIVFYAAMQPFQVGLMPAWGRIIVILGFAAAFIVLGRSLCGRSRLYDERTRHVGAVR